MSEPLRDRFGKESQRFVSDLSQRFSGAVGRVGARLATQATTTNRREGNDLRVSGLIRDMLSPLVEEAGFELRETEVTSDYDRLHRKVNMLVRGGERYFLVDLPNSLIRTATDESVKEVSWLHFLFPPDSRLFILSYRGDAMQVPLLRVLDEFYRIRATFIPWLHVAGDDNTTQPVEVLLHAFKFTRAPAADGVAGGADDTPPAEARPQRLEGGDLDAVCANLVEQLATAPGGAREHFDDFVERLDLTPEDRQTAKANWNDTANRSARRLLTWAAARGGRTVAAILCLLITDAPGREDAESVLKILERCTRTDPDRLDELRARVEGAR